MIDAANLDRRDFIQKLGAFSLLLGLSNCTSAQNGENLSGKSGPNFLFLPIDDLNDWIGALGTNANVKTPHIDRLARTGMLFTNAHAQAPICSPSRASVMTGLYPHETGFYGQLWDHQLRDELDGISETPFLSEYFKGRGYYTAARGKVFHKGAPDGAFHEHWHDSRGGDFGPKPAKRLKWDSNRTHTDWGAFPETDEAMIDYQTAEWGAAWLKKVHKDPFFLALGMIRPHVPWHAPQKWFDLYPLEDIELPPWLETDMSDIPAAGRALTSVPQMPTIEWAIENNEWRPIVQSYLASVSFVDHCIGMVLEALRASEYSHNTYVILFSDNGYHLGEKSRFAKMSLWQRSTRVPLIIAGPRIEPGVSSDPVGLIDLYPTIVELAALPENSENSGRSLVPILQGGKLPIQPVMSVFGKDNFAVTDHRFRYIRYENGDEELYDLIKDPNEWENVANSPDYVAVKQRLAQHIPVQTRPAVEAYIPPARRRRMEEEARRKTFE